MKQSRPEQAPGDLLIIGYGNELRSDDGVGPKVAETVARWRFPGVRTMVYQQLMPELAGPLATASRVVFVDAAIDCRSVQVREVEPQPSTQVMAHAVDPGALLQLTKTLYGCCPPALFVSIPAADFSFGGELSEVCRKGMQAALDHICALAKCHAAKT